MKSGGTLPHTKLSEYEHLSNITLIRLATVWYVRERAGSLYRSAVFNEKITNK